jgi:hypothetical protein
MDFAADLDTPARAIQVGDDGRQREQYADQGHQHGAQDCRGDADGGEVDGRQAPSHRGVDDSIRHDRKLGDKNRPGQVQECAGG